MEGRAIWLRYLHPTRAAERSWGCSSFSSCRFAATQRVQTRAGVAELAAHKGRRQRAERRNSAVVHVGAPNDAIVSTPLALIESCGDFRYCGSDSLIKCPAGYRAPCRAAGAASIYRPRDDECMSDSVGRYACTHVETAHDETALVMLLSVRHRVAIDEMQRSSGQSDPAGQCSDGNKQRRRHSFVRDGKDPSPDRTR